LKTVFFDLDGTIIDSFGGFKDAILYAVRPFGHEPDDVFIRSGLGPPLRDTFGRLGIDDIEEAVRLYRERYTTSSYKEHPVFPGMSELLHRLNADGDRMFVATSKPTAISVEILKHLELAHLFEQIVGATMDASRDAKIDVLRYALAQAGRPEQATMIGDRNLDVEAANELGLRSIGVTWGGADRAELIAAGAHHIVDSAEELSSLL
jgi:phosphoglycolate phosphatase